MTALSENRKTKERNAVIRNFSVLDEEIMYAGGIGAILSTTGELEMASDKANLIVVGRVEEYVDNSDDGEKCSVKTGCFLFANSSTNAVTTANIGGKCYVEDDNTVSSDGGTNSIVAGTVFDLDSNGVWVTIAATTPA